MSKPDFFQTVIRFAKALNIRIVALTVGVNLFTTTTTATASDDIFHVRLQDRLDRPSDGYCLDILGTNRTLRTDLPLFAHNCKSGPTPDSAVRYNAHQQLVFPAVNVCVTAFGVNNTVLPGTSILLRPCDERTPFFEASGLQQFEHTSNGQLKLVGSELCLAAGSDSRSTYSPRDRWRILSLESCTDIGQKYSSWELVPLR